MLVHAQRCRLIVLAIEIGGRFSSEAATFLRLPSSCASTCCPGHPSSKQRPQPLFLVSRFFFFRALLFAAWRSEGGSGVARTVSADQVPGHLDFGISPMPGVPPQGRRGRRDAWGGGWGGNAGGGCSRGCLRHLGRCGLPGLASWDWLQKGLELPGSIVRTTSRWMLGWQLVAEPRGRLCFWLAQGAGGSPQFLRSIALRLPWPKRPGDNGRGDPVGGVPHISKSYLNQIQTIFKIHLKYTVCWKKIIFSTVYTTHTDH